MDIQQINQHLARAENLKQAGNYLAAIRTCEEILLENLNCSLAYEEIGDNYLSLHQLKKAEKALLQAKKFNLNSPNTAYLLGFLYSCQEDWQRSLVELERANKLKPNHPEVLRCLGWTLYQLGKQGQGIILLKRAHALAPNDPFTLTDLGMCYLNQENFYQAQEVLEEALRLDPRNKIVKDCLQNFFRVLEAAKRKTKSKK